MSILNPWEDWEDPAEFLPPPPAIPPTLSSNTKDDSSKPMVFSLVLSYFPRALEEIARVSEFGMKKYNAKPETKGFLQVDDGVRRYSDGLVRHLLAEAKGETFNKADGDLWHAAQTAWNSLARLEMLLIEDDDAGDRVD